MIKLQPVNVHTAFCRGCGIAPAPSDGRECPTCLTISKAVWNVHEPLPLKILIAIGAALGFLVAAVTYAVKRGWV